MSSWEGGEAVRVEDKGVLWSASFPPSLDFHKAIHLMWLVDAFHGADDVVSAPDFCVSGDVVVEVDGGVGHVGGSFSCLYPLGLSC